MREVERFKPFFLLVSIFFIATCGIFYELLLSALSSYLVGDTVLHFSLVIGFFLSAMGLGAFLSRQIQRRLLQSFVMIELVIAGVGGWSGVALFGGYLFFSNLLPLLLGLVVLLGTLIGMELPLLLRIFESFGPLRLTVSAVLTADYIGALFASLLFPLFFLPEMGFIQSSFFFGGVNALVALVNLYLFASEIAVVWLKPVAWGVTCMLLVMIPFSSAFTGQFDKMLYEDEIIFSRQSSYQRIVLTRHKERVNLYLNGNLQFSSVDEYRYHEVLVHPAMGLLLNRQKVLIGGGGDGLALREILKYPEVERVVLVELDSAVVTLARDNPVMRQLNRAAFLDPRVEVVIQDAKRYIRESSELFNLIVLDFPDPSTVELAQLFTKTLYMQLRYLLAHDGLLVVQATSPYYTPRAFWCIEETLREAGYYTLPLHVYVPSFGEWGFIVASPYTRQSWKRLRKEMVQTKFYRPDRIYSLSDFPGDLLPSEKVEANTLETLQLLHYYREDWKAWE
ncbi:MAG: polyamine aminopropyltransferase [Bacteroidia bacterium]|nr:polyamine aminopropyltransferase [Bacteroidia bacterium]